MSRERGWAAATKGQKQHWFEGDRLGSACGRFERAPATDLHADEGEKRAWYCAACDKLVEAGIRGKESPQDVARRALGQKAILLEATAIAKETERELADLLGVGGRLTIPGVGKVWTTDPKGTWKVVDRPAFVRWCEKNLPHAIVPAVDPMVEKALLMEGHTKDGEIPDGFEFVVGASSLTVSPAEDARELARQLVRPILPEVDR